MNKNAAKALFSSSNSYKGVVQNLGSFPGEIWNWPLYTEGKERLKTEADDSRLTGGRFNKQEDLYTRLVLGGYKTSRSRHLPARIFKIHVEAWTGFSHIDCPDGLNVTLLSQGWDWWAEQGREVRSLPLPEPSSQVNRRSSPLNDLLQQKA